MTSVARERLAALLGELSTVAAFSARASAPIDDLDIEVRGVGLLGVLISSAQARQLVGVGRPARYGQGTRTLIDRRVRDTTEIPKNRVKIDQRRWNQTLLPVLGCVTAQALWSSGPWGGGGLRGQYAGPNKINNIIEHERTNGELAYGCRVWYPPSMESGAKTRSRSPASAVCVAQVV